MPTAEVTLPGLASSTPTARRFAESVLAGWGQPDLGWTAAQVVSELAANCAIHARTDFSVRVTLDPGGARLEVRDGSPVGVSPRAYSDTATTGRGLRMVEALSSGWGVDLAPSGKTVWVQLALPGGGGDDEDDLGRLLDAFDPDAQAVVLPLPARPRTALPELAAA
jgi:anti-sigma regulatory factor (Ser/Thr protein kinase)